MNVFGVVIMLVGAALIAMAIRGTYGSVFGALARSFPTNQEPTLPGKPTFPWPGNVP